VTLDQKLTLAGLAVSVMGMIFHRRTSIGAKSMSEKQGIKELKEVVAFGMALEKAGVDILVGGFHADKLGEILNIIPVIGPAFEGIGGVVPELEDLSAEEAAELAAYAVSLGAMSEKAAEIVSKSLKVAGAAWELVKAIRA
jgi:hypothetical protein